MQTALKSEPEVKVEVESNIILSLIPGILNIGQATENDVQIEDSDISQYHARIVTYFRESYLIDVGSESGTLLNGERVTKHSIKPGDVITLGNHNIIIHAPADWFY